MRPRAHRHGDHEAPRRPPWQEHAPQAEERAVPPSGVRSAVGASILDLYFRADAAFAKPEVYERLEAANVHYAIRLPANQVLQRRISYLLTLPVGRPSKQPIVSYASFTTKPPAGRGRVG
jgi:hypothetical protein